MRISRPTSLVRLLLPLLWSGWVALGFVRPVSAQTPSLNQLRLDYDEALDALEAQKSAWDSKVELWQAALNAADAAYRQRDNARGEARDREATALSQELGRLRREAEIAERTLEARRQAYETGVERQITALETRLGSAPALEGSRIRLDLQSLYATYEQLQTESASARNRPTLLYLRDFGVEIDRTMSRADITDMVGLLNRRVAELQVNIGRITERIASLKRAQNAQRSAADRARTLDRFGGADPVGAARPSSAATSDAAPPQSLREQIEGAERLKAEMELMLQQLENRVLAIRREYGLGGME